VKTQRDLQYQTFSRQQWIQRDSSLPPCDFSKKQWSDLNNLCFSLSEQEIKEVYLPCGWLLLQRYRHAQGQQLAGPLTIGITGSVAVGKTTLAALLRCLLSCLDQTISVAVLSTDDFLYSNKTLEAKGLDHRKGFPDSYDMPAMLDFLTALKAGDGDLTTPMYSHESYDIVEGQRRMIDQPDIVIMEGLNALSLTSHGCCEEEVAKQHGFVDFGIFIAADMAHIESWFIRRAEQLARTDFVLPDAYFHALSLMYPEQLRDYLTRVWREINLENYEQHIVSSRDQAHLIIEKGVDHSVGRLWLRE